MTDLDRRATSATADLSTNPVAEVERLIAASPERVFDAWLDPATLGRFLSPSGRADVEIDGSVGGRFRVTMLVDEGMPAPPEARDGGLEHTGEYLEIDRHRRLSFTWISPYTGPEPSVVTIDFEPIGSATRLRLRHQQLPPGAVASHLAGWQSILANLARLLEEG